MNRKRIWAFLSFIQSKERKNVILDTDAFNEIDDQFCIAYLMKRPEEIHLLAINAAPFFNENSTGPADGMERSYQEILKLREMVDPDSKIPVFRGSDAFMTDRNTPVYSEACDNIIKTVMESEEKVIIVAIGAITNVASAILKCPEIATRAGVIWLGGHATHVLQDQIEFNLRGDIAAAQVVFDSGIDLLQVPCLGVCSEVSTTPAELGAYLSGKNEVCDYLTNIVTDVCKHKYAGSRVIWDVTTATTLLRPDAYEVDIQPCPKIADDGRYLFDKNPHRYLYVHRFYRDRVFEDLFRTLADER